MSATPQMRGAERSEHTYPVTSGFIPTISLYFNKGGGEDNGKTYRGQEESYEKEGNKKESCEKENCKKESNKKENCSYVNDMLRRSAHADLISHTSERGRANALPHVF